MLLPLSAKCFMTTQSVLSVTHSVLALVTEKSLRQKSKTGAGAARVWIARQDLVPTPVVKTTGANVWWASCIPWRPVTLSSAYGPWA